MKNIPDNIKAALIDLDGTIFDTMGIWEKIDIEWLRLHQLPYSQDYSKSIQSKSFAEAADFTIRFFNLRDIKAEEIMSEWYDMAKYEYSHNIRPKPMVKEYLSILKTNGIRLVVVTSLSSDLYEPLLKNNGLYDMFEFFLSTVDSGIGKEKPYIYQSAADILGVKNDDCIVFEDILQGILSAKSINMRTVAVYDYSSREDSENLRIASDAYIESFSEAPLPKKTCEKNLEISHVNTR